MKRHNLPKAAAGIIIMLAISVLSCTPHKDFGTTYYVDATNGSDTFSGIMKSERCTEWPNSGIVGGPLEHAPGMEGYTGTAVLKPGDVVVFKKGETWNHNMIAAVEGVTYTTDDTWGTGDATFDLAGKHFGIRIKASNITVKNLKFTGGDPTPFPTAPNSNNCEGSKQGGECSALLTFEESGLNDACISIAPDGITAALGYIVHECSVGINTDGVAADLTEIEVSNCKFIDSKLGAIHMKFATNTLIRNNTINASNVIQPTYMTCGNLFSEIYLSTGCKYVTVANNDISGTSGIAAIFAMPAWGNDPSEKFPQTISTSCVSNGVTYALEYTNYETEFPEHITIERNKVHDAWSSGLFIAGSHNIIQYNEIYDMNKTESPAYVAPVMDGDTVISEGKAGYGFYMLGTSFSYDSDIRYNMVHDCYAWPSDKFYSFDAFGTWHPKWEGHAFYLEGNSWNNRYYGNLVYNNETMGLHGIVGGDNTIFNNTFYNNGSGPWADATISIVLQPGNGFYNNIIANSAATGRTAIKINGEAGGSIGNQGTENPWVANNNTNLSFVNNIFYDSINDDGMSKYIDVSADTYSGTVHHYTIQEFEAYALTNPSTYVNVSGNNWLNPKFINPSAESSLCDLRLLDDSPAFGLGYYDADYMTNLKLLDPIEFVAFENINSKAVVGSMPVGAFAYKDEDNDGVDDISDNCPAVCNPQQLDANGNGIGDLCDPDPEYGWRFNHPACEHEC